MKKSIIKKDSLLIWCIILIIILGIIYLVKKYRDENRDIENFNNLSDSVPRSLSTFNKYETKFSNWIMSSNRKIDDSNTKEIIKNITNKIRNAPDPNKRYGLNNFWPSNDNKMFMATYQTNDLLLISISYYNITANSPYKQTGNTNGIQGQINSGDTFTANSNCPLNTFSAVCQLNYFRNKFYLKNKENIMCNTLFNDSDYCVNTIFWGKIIRYYDENKNDNLIEIKIYENNKLIYTFTISDDEEKRDMNYSTDLTSYFALKQNELNTPYPYIPNTVYGLTDDGNTVTNKVTFMPINMLSQTSGTVLNKDSDTLSYNLCSLINQIGGTNKKFNVYIFYVSDFVNVLSLDYDFYGVGEENSSLTLKKTSASDALSNALKTYLNKTPAQTYKSINNLNNISSYLYMVNNSDSINSADIDKITNTYAKTIPKTIVTPVTNNPILWKLSASYRTTSCFVSLSAQKDGNNIEKYATFYPNGSTNMDLNEGGINQELVVEDFNVIKGDASNYFIGSGLFRTNDLLYLAPNSSNTNLQQNQTVSLISKPNANGKWIIIGTTNPNPSIDNIKSYIDGAYSS